MRQALSHRAIRTRGLLLALAVASLDQLVKFIMMGPFNLPARGVQGMPIGLPFFKFTFAMNEGVSYGMLTAGSETQRWLLVAFTAVISLGVAIWLWRERNVMEASALGLILGGAVGNLIDRARLGYVIDYADFHIGAVRPFAIFNLADAAITMGVALLIVRALFLHDNAEPASDV